MHFFIGTTNQGKLQEYHAILSSYGINTTDFEESGGFSDVSEDCDTFVGNAEKKAMEIASQVGFFTLADDSGLRVLSLGGAPGVLSGRYSPLATDHNSSANYELLLENLDGVIDRRAVFITALSLAGSDGVIKTFTGTLEGTISRTPRGRNGFSYDKIFVPKGFRHTLAEMTLSAKDTISHRSLAINKMARFIRKHYL